MICRFSLWNGFQYVGRVFDKRRLLTSLISIFPSQENGVMSYSNLKDLGDEEDTSRLRSQRLCRLKLKRDRVGRRRE